VGTRIVTDPVPGEARADNGGAGVLTLAGVPIGQAEDAPARLAEALASADVVLSLHRAEGFGLLMATGQLTVLSGLSFQSPFNL